MHFYLSNLFLNPLDYRDNAKRGLDTKCVIGCRKEKNTRKIIERHCINFLTFILSLHILFTSSCYLSLSSNSSMDLLRCMILSYSHDVV